MARQSADPISLTKSQLGRLGKVLDSLPKPRIPKRNRWRSMSDDDIWWQIVGQVAVVGNVAGWEKMQRDQQAFETLRWSVLSSLTMARARTRLWQELRRCGVRFVARRKDADRKSMALARNLSVLSAEGGPRAFTEDIAAIRGDVARAEHVMAKLHYVKEKGARDFLIGLGLGRDVVALDVRVVNILKALGVELGDASITSGAGYLAVEQALRVAAPGLGMPSLAYLDRALFGNYKRIIEALAGHAPRAARGHRSHAPSN